MNLSLPTRLPAVSASEEQTLFGSCWLGCVRIVSDWPRPAFVALLAGLVATVGWIDYATGVELSVSLLYLLPISLGTWVGGRSLGGGVALVSAFVWLGGDFLAGHAYGHWLVPVFNTLTLAVSFLVVVALIASLREVNDDLEQTVAQRTNALQDENTQRREVEEELRRALGDARSAHAELQRTQFQLIESAKLESVGRLAAGVAHEIKNPLMTLSLGADYFVNHKPGNPEEARLVLDMKEAVHRASNVINILLDYARPRPLQCSNENLRDLIENSLTLVRHQVNKQHVTVVREFDAALPLLSLDRTRIEHVFVNLFLNALQAMPPGGVLTIRTFASDLGSGDPGIPERVIVEVSDTGCGIPPENTGKLFEPFFTTKPPGQGTGLGLAIIRRIMEIHGGSIQLINREGGGARVTLQFNTRRKETP